jgi:hypothetical protein
VVVRAYLNVSVITSVCFENNQPFMHYSPSKQSENNGKSQRNSKANRSQLQSNRGVKKQNID